MKYIHPIIFASLIMCSYSYGKSLKPLEELKNGPSDNSARSLRKWRFLLATHLVNIKDIESFAPKYKEVNDIVNSCFPDEKPKCLEDLEYYSYTKAKPHEYHTARNIYKDSRDRLLTSEKQLPKAFQGGEGKVIIPDNIEELAKENGWKTVLYKTKSTGGFDGNANLYIVAIPLGEGANKWEKFAVFQTSPEDDAHMEENRYDPVPKPANGNHTNAAGTLTMISYDGTKFPPEGTITSMTRTYNTDGKVAYHWSNQNRINSCTRCHSGPFRPISPVGHGALHGKEKAMSAEHQRKTDEMNRLLDKFSSWGKVKYGDRVHRLGPPMESQPYGWAPKNSKTRSDDYIKRCSENRQTLAYYGFNSYNANIVKNPAAQIDTYKIRNAMNCYSCHNNIRHGKLHENYSWREIEFKVAIHQNMPIGVDLSNDERLALLSCLKQEFQDVRGEWQKKAEWMLSSQCADLSIQPKCNQSTNKPQSTTQAISQ